MAQRRIGYLCYSTFLALAAPVNLFRALADNKSKLTFKNISGISKPVIWVHAATERQLTAAGIILQDWGRLFSGYQPILTYAGRNASEAVQWFYPEHQLIVLPYPVEFCSQKIINRIKPCLLLMIEDCFYPRLIRFCKAAGSKVALINGRVNPRPALIRRLAPNFFKAVFEQIDLLVMDSVDEANRIGELGAKLSSILVSNAVGYRNGSPDESEINGNDSTNKVIGTIAALLGRDH